MPTAFAILINSIIGYLDFAALGALSLDLLPKHSCPPHAELLALLVIGPLGALMGLIIPVSQQEARKTRGA
jgi:hypothetical protein